ncbi:HWE histidine kinase domain-containing protein [Bradyrhizobium sp. McL0616]|uniref:HWE histidine kinase domain-containing protein n=1 Tax=Bradyrhizobium sp. McL0616 TaxID=3415674 RepID=UPI003CF9D9E5
MNPPVDLTNCDREPIHTPGSIQPHGAMIICDPNTGIISHASANAAAFLGLDESGIIGKTLGDAIGETAAHDLRNAAAKAGGSQTAGALRAHKLPNIETPFDIAIHTHNQMLFVELEVSAPLAPNADDPLDMTQSAVRRIGLENSIDRIAATAAKLVRAMLGYDRVMVYRFLHNGAGQVIAEAKSAGLHSFMGQFFPASDIPVQARRLYLLNWIRMIADAGYTPVPILPLSQAEVSPIDMSHAHLRSVSPIHCEYLSNIGVAGSLSISIVVDEQLWGLIACHHDQPRIIPLPQRLGAELFGQYFSLQVAGAERRAEFIAASAAREKLDSIIALLAPDEPVNEIMASRLADFASLIPCNGAGLWIDGKWSHTGVVPPAANIPELTDLIDKDGDDAIWQTHELRALLGSTEYGKAVAGALAVPLSSHGRDYLLYFRSEESYNIEWAGEPKKQIVSSPLGDRLTPRGSFETWREEVRGQSKPWTDADRTVAESVRNYLRDVVLRHAEATAEERARADRRRRMLNDELNHRVKNIIALVKSIALQTGANAKTVEDYSRSLEGRLRALAFAHDQSLSGRGGDLLALMEAEASLHRYGNDEDHVAVNGPPLGLNDRAFGVVALLMHEMMTNAAKYGALSKPEGHLSIKWILTDAGECEIYWVETGGPVVAAPSTTGFGSKLIRTSVEYDLGGEVSIDYRSTGLVGHFKIPARHVMPPFMTRSVPQSTPTSVDNSQLKGQTILLVEDQALIAMDIEEALLKLGATKVHSVPNVSAALAILAEGVPDLAVLDLNLDGETSSPLADDLKQRGVPFLFATGYGDSVTIPSRFADVPVVRKPVTLADLAAKVCIALAARAFGEG